MFRNYFLTAWRNFTKDKLHSFINVLGLSIGMTVAVLIGLWTYDELSFDKNFNNYDSIGRVLQNVTNNGEVQTWWSLPFPLAQELRTNYGKDFRHIVMGVNSGNVLTIGDKKIKDQGAFFEKEMPDMFTLKMLKGQRNALYDPTSVIISSSAAKAYFGDAEPLNQVIRPDQMPPMKVAGVYADFPQNSSFAGLHFISSWDYFYKNQDVASTEDPWRPNFVTLYAQINDNVGFNTVSARIRDAKFRKVNAQLQKKKPELFLLPMNKWHLYSEYKDGKNAGGAIRYVKMFVTIGVFVLLLACINFMNLSTARSERRAKEVGIRKTIGSLRVQLVGQFFSESLLTVFFAFGLSLFLAWLALPLFNQIANKQLVMLTRNPFFWLMGISFVLITAFIAGSYPAFYLSSFRPVRVLKGTFKVGRFAAIPRKILVVLQFSVSVSLIIGTIVVYQQIQYAKLRPVGYSRANLISISTSSSNVHDHFEAVKEELVRTGSVESIAESESPTTGIWNSTSGFSWPGKDPNLSTDFGVVTASFDYGKTIGWEVKEGRGFSREFLTDSSAVILNEAAVHYMNLKNPIGQTMTWWGQPLRVIGIIHDMVIESPYGVARPVIYTLSNSKGNLALVRLKPGLSTHAISGIENIFKRINPDEPFEYKFVDDDYASKFGDEERVGKLSGIFSMLAIFISCLGLFGLTSFVAEQRRKEIGVRKVLGASVYGVWHLLSKDFVALVLIAFLIATPVSYYFMYNWLQSYTYRTGISWWVFLGTGLVAMVVTLLTVSVQSIRAAIANPVKSLRTE